MSDSQFPMADSDEIVNILPGLKPGDVIFLRVGLTSDQMGGDQSPFIPSNPELEAAKAKWIEVVPEGVHVIADHIGVEPFIVRFEKGEVK
jgi:hypothetical protein